MSNTSNTARSLSRVVLALALAGVAGSAIAADKPAATGSNKASSKDIERGRYLVMITGCNDCHTPNFLTCACTSRK